MFVFLFYFYEEFKNVWKIKNHYTRVNIVHRRKQKPIFMFYTKIYSITYGPFYKTRLVFLSQQPLSIEINWKKNDEF